MKDDNYLALDGHALRIFLTVLEQGSVGTAAEKLGVTKTVIGNNLTRLRSVFHDPLFVRTGGQEIVATARAERMADNVRALLEGMQDLTVEQDFSPEQARLHFTVAANDFQRDLILPELYRQVAAEVKAFSLNTILSDYPSVELLRSGKADLLLSPIATEGGDILCKRLLIDQPRCYFDAEVRLAPRTLADFRAARYVGLELSDTVRARPTVAPISAQLEKQVVVRVPSFSDMAAFVKGTDMLAIAPGMLRLGDLSGLISGKLPFNMPSIFIFMLWHQRYQSDPAHQWLRMQLEYVVGQLAQQLKRVA